MKFLIILLMLVLIQGCNSGQGLPESKPTPEVPQTSQPSEDHSGQGSTPVGAEYPVPNVKKIFTVVVKDTNYTSAQKEKLKKASELIARLMNSEEFKTRVLSFTYQGKKQFVDNDGLSNEKIWEKVFRGAEALMPAENYQMDLVVEMYHSYSSTIGYTTPDSLEIWTNSKYHNGYSPCDIAGNLFHEWTHKLGFDHAEKYSPSRDSSVPYGLGYLVEELCNKL